MRVICFGDLVVDLISQEPGTPLWAVETFRKYPGGSPANVAIGLHAHGVPVALWSKVGADAGGRYLRHRLAALGLPTEGILVDPAHPTKLALIGLDDAGDRTWEMQNADSAYENIHLDDFDAGALATARVLHLGGAALLAGPTSATALRLAEAARAVGCLVSFDPNLIVGAAPGRAGILQRLEALLPCVDLLKMSADDWADLLGEATPGDLLGRGVSLVIRTGGARGAHFYTPRHTVFVPSVPVEVVDATGAGDAFTAAVLARLSALAPPVSLAEVPPEALKAWGCFATEWACAMLRHPGAVGGYFACQ